MILLAATGRLDRHDPFGLGPAPSAGMTDGATTAGEVRRDDRRAASPTGRADRPRARWRRLVLGADGDRLLGQAPVWMGISPALLVISGLSLVGSAASSLGIDFEGGVAWDVPAGDLTVDDARGVLDDARHRERHGQDPGAQLRQRRHHQGPGRGPARGRARRRCRRRSPRPPASTRPTSAWPSVSASWGEEITRRRSSRWSCSSP